GGAVRSGARDVGLRNLLAAVRDVASDDEQRLQLVGDGSVLRIALDFDDDLRVAEMVRGDRAVNGLAVAAVVMSWHERRYQLTLPGRERLRPPQQHVDQFVERLRGFRPECHRPANAGQSFSEWNVSHQAAFSRWNGRSLPLPSAVPSCRTPARRSASA